MISANVGLIKGFSFQHKHIISYLQITEANIYKLFIKQGCYLFLFFLRGNLIIFQPRPQGAFPWLWRWDGPPKPGKSALGTRLLIFRELSFPFSAALDSFQRSIKIFSSASDHGVLRIWRPFTTRLRNMASQGAKDTHLKWNTAKSLVQTSIKVATHSEVDTNNRSSSWNLPKSFRLFSCPHEKISGIVFT